MKAALLFSMFALPLIGGWSAAGGQNEPLDGGRRIFVGIGIKDYKNWGILPTSVNDVTDMKKLLTTDFGFIAPDGFQLVNEKANRNAIVNLVEDDLHSFIRPNDDLVFIFSGHGNRRDDVAVMADGKTKTLTRGFIVPYDAPRPEDKDWVGYIDVIYLLNAVGSLPARHILVILDSCYSGLAIRGAIGSPKGSPIEEELNRKLGRNIIAAALSDQQADSSSPDDLDHSVLTGLLIRGLKTGGASSGLHGFVPGLELGAYAQQKLKDSPMATQTPVTGTFAPGRDDDGGGDILFRFKVSVPDVTKLALHEIEEGDIENFRSDAQRMISAFPGAPQSMWAKYRLDLITGDIADAQAMVDKISALEDDHRHESEIGNDAGVLSNKLGNLPFLKYPMGETPLSFDLSMGTDKAALKGSPELLPVSAMMYQALINKPVQIAITNSAAYPVTMNCFSIPPEGVLSTDLCPLDLGAKGGNSIITIDAIRGPQVIEYHFFVTPKEIGPEPGSSPQPHVQTAIRIQYRRPEASP